MTKVSVNSTIYLLLFLIPPLCYWTTLSTYSIEAPTYDDYLDILEFFNNFTAAHSWLDKIGLIVAQYNEHRVVISRIIYTAMYALIGHIDFKLLSIVGNLSILGLVGLFCLQFKSHPQRWPIWLCISFALFNMLPWQTIFCAMQAISNFYVGFFALLALHCLHGNGKFALPLATICAIAATFTMGNGIAIWPVGAVILMVSPKLRFQQERYLGQVIIWLSTFLVCVIVYFIGYRFPDLPAFLGKLTRVDILMAQPQSFVLWFLTFLGDCIVGEESSSVSAAALFGCINLCGILIFTLLGYLKKYPVLWGYLLFIVVTALIATWGRFHVSDSSAALANRYKIYSTSLTLILFLFLCDYLITRFPQSKVYLAWLLVLPAMAFWMRSYAANLSMIENQQNTFSQGINYWLTEGGNGGLFAPLIFTRGAALQKSISLGLYSPEVILEPYRRVKNITTQGGCADQLQEPLSYKMQILNKEQAVMVGITGEIQLGATSTSLPQLYICGNNESRVISLTQENLRPVPNKAEWYVIDIAARKSILPTEIGAAYIGR